MKQYTHPKYRNIKATRDGKIYIDCRLAKPSVSDKGYLVLWVPLPAFRGRTGKLVYGKSRKVHQLVYECLTGDMPKYAAPGLCINHIDNDKTNNAFCNLELIHSSKNTAIGKRKLYVIRKNGTIYTGHHNWIHKQVGSGKFNRMVLNRKTSFSDIEMLAYQEPYGKFVTINS